jgi:UDP-N-acetylglucosamine 4-epimerase
MQSRDFTYIANVVQANLKACIAPNVGGEVFNVACGGRISVNEILEEINKIAGKKIVPTYVEIRKGDITHSHADIHKAASLLDYEPEVSFADGLRKTVDWYRENVAAAVSVSGR